MKGYDSDLIIERLMSQRHWKEQRILDPRPPEPIYKDDVQPQNLSLAEYAKVPIGQSADL